MRIRLCLAALVCAVMSVIPTLGAEAQDGRLELLRQSAYVPAEGVYEAELDWSGPFRDDLSISVLIHTPISVEDEVTSTPTGVLNRTQPTPITDLPRNGSIIQINIAVRSVSAADERILLRDPGVYPVTIEVRGTEGTVASLRSNLIRLPNDLAEIDPLPVAVILGVTAAEGITLRDAPGLLRLAPRVPLTVQLDDGALTQLEVDSDLAIAVRDALGDREVLVSPAFNLDPSALAEISENDLYQRARDRTDEQLRALDLNAVRDTIPFDSDLTDAGVELLRSVGVSSVVRANSGGSSGGLISTPVGGLKVLEVDAELTGHLAAGPRSVERTHQLIAILAVRHAREKTPVLLGGSASESLGIEPTSAFLDALVSSGLMRPVGLSEAAALSPQLPLLTVERPNQNLNTVAGDIARVRSLLRTYSEFHVSGGLLPVTAENNILTSLSQDRNPSDRSRALAGAEAVLLAAMDPISLPEGQAITLAATKSLIPLTILNSADGPRRVQLRFTSRKVQVSEQNSLHVLQPGLNTLEINVEARSLGLSPLQVQVFSPDGSTSLATSSFQIRSTAVPGLGYALTAAALAILLAWWLSDATKRRKARLADSDAGGRAIGTSVAP